MESSDRRLSEVLSWYLPGGTEENHENFSEENRSPNRSLNLGHPKYEGKLPTQPRRAVNPSSGSRQHHTFLCTPSITQSLAYTTKSPKVDTPKQCAAQRAVCTERSSPAGGQKPGGSKHVTRPDNEKNVELNYANLWTGMRGFILQNSSSVQHTCLITRDFENWMENSIWNSHYKFLLCTDTSFSYVCVYIGEGVCPLSYPLSFFQSIKAKIYNCLCIMRR